MASFPCVHHVEIGAVDGARVVDMLTSQFTFKVKATRQTAAADQWLLVKENARVLVTCLRTPEAMLIEVCRPSQAALCLYGFRLMDASSFIFKVLK